MMDPPASWGPLNAGLRCHTRGLHDPPAAAQTTNLPSDSSSPYFPNRAGQRHVSDLNKNLHLKLVLSARAALSIKHLEPWVQNMSLRALIADSLAAVSHPCLSTADYNCSGGDTERRSCQDLVRDYHEAGHTALELAFGYGLSASSIEPHQNGDGVSSRIFRSGVKQPLSPRSGSGRVAGNTSQDVTFQTEMCDSGSAYDRLMTMTRLVFGVC
jgi:hypothetical protein